jgi:hypothetical protein
VQVYSDGSEAAWVEPTVGGQPEPERSAPVLALSAPADDAAVATPTTTATGAGDASQGTLALVAAVVALLTGLAVVLGWRAGRRTVSS